MDDELAITRRLDDALDEKKRQIYYRSYYGSDDPYTTEPSYTGDMYSHFKYMNETELIAARIELLLNRSQYEVRKS